MSQFRQEATVHLRGAGASERSSWRQAQVTPWGQAETASAVRHCAEQMDSERARELLRRERDRIEQALAQLGVPGTDELEGDGTADSGSRLYEEEFDEGQVDDLRAELASVEHAEERLAAGTFGLSVESGEPIPDERLEAVPTAERTVEEQTRFERQAR
jgi:DnaK suppressor protein